MRLIRLREWRRIEFRNLSLIGSKRPRKTPAVDQDILAVDVACMLAAEEGAGFAELFGVTKALGWKRCDAGGFDVFCGFAHFGRLRGEIAFQAVGIENTRQQVIDRDALGGEAGAGDASHEAC